MPKPRKPQTQNEPNQLENRLGVIANLLGLIATKDMNEGDKIGALNAAGFTNQEVARLLEKDTNTVYVTLFKRRKKTQPKRK